MPPPQSTLRARVTTNISPLTSLTLLLMTPLPEAFPSADTLHDPLFARFSAAVVDAVTIAPRFVRFLPSLAFLFSFSFSFFQHYCIPPQEKQGLAFSLSVSISSPAPLTIVLLFSYPPLCSCRRDPRATLSPCLFIHSCALGPREGAALKLH